MVELWQPLLLMACGVAAGFINVMAGGGSMLTIPVLVFMGVPGPVANGTNRIAIVAQNATAVYAFFRRGFSDFRLSLSLAAAAIPGAIAGALAGVQLRGVWFNRVLAIIMIIVLIMTWRKNTASTSSQIIAPSRQRLLTAHVCMVLVGFYGGFIQIGVGFLLIAVLHQVLGLDFVQVNMHKVWIAGAFNTVALLIYAFNVELLWVFGLALAIGNSIGGWLGATVSVNRGEQAIKWVLNTVLIIFIIKLIM